MKNKFEFAAALQKYSNVLILDLGCRNKELQPYLESAVTYQGIDFEDSEYVLKHNLEEGIPFENKSFDVVFALDILEHLENIHFLMHEIRRVARNEAIIALPNCYHWHYKLNIMRGKPLNTKYILPNEKTIDRHRWLTYHGMNVEFLKNVYNGEVITHFNFTCRYTKYRILSYVDRCLCLFFPNSFVYTDFFHIDFKKST